MIGWKHIPIVPIDFDYSLWRTTMIRMTMDGVMTYFHNSQYKSQWTSVCIPDVIMVFLVLLLHWRKMMRWCYCLWHDTWPIDSSLPYYANSYPYWLNCSNIHPFSYYFPSFPFQFDCHCFGRHSYIVRYRVDTHAQSMDYIRLILVKFVGSIHIPQSVVTHARLSSWCHVNY